MARGLITLGDFNGEVKRKWRLQWKSDEKIELIR